MKNFKIIFFVCTLFFVQLAAQAQKKGEETMQIETSAVCDMCKKTLEKAMAYEKGVKSSSLDVPSKVLTVTYDSKKTNPENIRKAVTATGYDADAKPADQRAYHKLNDCCKKEAGDH